MTFRLINFRIAAVRCAAVLASAALLMPVNAAPTPAIVTVNWSGLAVGLTTRRTFGSNDEMCGQFSDGALDKNYAADLAGMGVRFLRLHSSTVENWTTGDKWDPAKVATELDAPYVRACGDAGIIVTIDDVPKWCRNADGSINDDNYAQFCAQLVKIVNVDMGRHVVYWECMNEPDSWTDFANNKWAPMFALYNRCVDAMKAVDPSIKVGGPVMSWYDNALTKAFLAHCWVNTGFLAWHDYMVGDNCNPPLDGPTIYRDVMAKTSRYNLCAAQARAAIEAQSKVSGDSHPIPLALDEFNIPWNWQSTGWGQSGYVGAAFFASALIHMANARIDITTNWSAKEANYGLIDMNDHMRLPAAVYKFANHDLVGAIVPSRSTDLDCECLAIDRGAGAVGDRRAVLIVNKYYGAKTVVVRFGLHTAHSASVTTIDSTGMRASTRALRGGTATFAMPGFSVAMVALR